MIKSLVNLPHVGWNSKLPQCHVLKKLPNDLKSFCIQPEKFVWLNKISLPFCTSQHTSLKRPKWPQTNLYTIKYIIFWTIFWPFTLVCSLLTYKYSLTGWKFCNGQSRLYFMAFEANNLCEKNHTSWKRPWEPGLEIESFSCVPFCFRSANPFESCTK